MSGLLQRLAAQALGASRPRIRSAAAMHAQVPLALPSHASREPSEGTRTPAGAAASTTVAPTPAASRENEAAAANDAASASGRLIAEAAIAQRIDDGRTPQPDVNAALTASVPVPESRAPAALLGQTAAPVMPAAGSIRPALLHQPTERSSHETTEVHVHIGRIEVTALPAPAAPTPKPRPVRPTVPLSDYLAKRRPS